MKIIAALCWYDEPLDFLDRCVRSLNGLVDHIVAVDGPWDLFPHGNQDPERLEQRAVREAAADIGVPVEVHSILGTWRSQVEKRDLMMRWAGDRGDWILVIDGDEYVAAADTSAVRDGLAGTDTVVATVTIKNLHQGGRIPGYHPDGGMTRRLYRSGTTVDIVHTGYFHEGQPLYRGEPELDLRDHLTIEHDICNRGDDRNRRAIEYRDAREREGVEVWV